jgi:exopolyphosphatase/guanosine-5'-triphosphate,3'-diphosphate pyrophosphatase
MPAMTLIAPAAPALAAIDMGSNSFRLEVAQLSSGQYRRRLYLKESVRLGAGLDEDSRLTEEAMQRGLACLHKFADALRGFAPERVRAVATQTLREARNRDEFLARAEAALGFPIEVISGREEARLIFAGVARLQVSRQPRLVIDIGGRSTEMILGRGLQPEQAESFQVGSVGLSIRFFPDGQLTAEAFRQAQIAAGAELEEALSIYKPARWKQALGSSGTVGAVSQVLAAAGITDGRITPDALRWCMDRALEAGHVDALKLPGLKEDRRPVVAGGLCILYTLLTQFGIQELLPAKGALRQGVIFDLAERLGDEGDATAPRLDMREASVLALQQRFGVDIAQADRVQALALSLHRKLQPQAPREARRELGWAAALHEMGMMVSHHDHHRHTAYLLAHVDAPGFSQNQLRRLGELALGQRGGLRKMDAQLRDETFLWQLLALRLAVVIHHGRDTVSTRALQLTHTGRKVDVRLPRAWMHDHPRTLFLLREELDAWTRSGVLELSLS